MAKKDNNKNGNNTKHINDVQNLNKSFTDSYDSLYATNGVPSHYHEIDRIGKNIDDIINSELTDTKSVTSDDMSTFMVKLFNDQSNKDSVATKSMEDIFSSKDGSLESFFQERYQNQNFLYDDLNLIRRQLAELNEAVKTTRDAVVSSDTHANTVARTITFDGVSQDSAIINNYISAIEAMEKEYSLPKNIKNRIVTNTLTYGKYYVYTIPYSELLEQQYKYKLQNTQNIGGVQSNIKESLEQSCCKTINESTADIDMGEYYSSIAKEIASVDTGFSVTSRTNLRAIESAFNDYCDNITVTNTISSIPLIEGSDVTKLLNDEAFEKLVKNATKPQKNKPTTFADATVDVDKKVNGAFDNVHGCYIKYIDPRKCIPVKILDTVIGYYYVHETKFKRDRAPFSTTIRVSNVVGGSSYAEDVESIFMHRLTDRIVDAFDPKFIENNQEFKELIINALTYNDLYRKQVNFQFIPAEYIVEFSVNEDEDGEGQSILFDALFYAKLYLALLVFKIISTLTRSNDTRVVYVKNGGIDTNITNKINDVARSIKSKQISFMDLLNYNSIISKIGQYKDIFMPVGRSGERGIEFDTIAGQQVDMNTDFMEFLRTNYINSTGVPSVIMNYINEADYAKSIKMGHIKFDTRCMSLQLDFNPSLTRLYRNIAKFSNVPIPEEVIEKLNYALTPSKALANQNDADTINNTITLIESIVRLAIGENDNSDKTNIVKDIFYKIIAKDRMPGLDWANIDEALRVAEMEAEKRLMVQKSSEE